MLRARIESLAYGPHGVARIDGKVHFVRGVTPGDLVEIAVREDRGSYAHADLVRVVESGPARREPPCPYLPRCGGCPWQQVDDAEQAIAKGRIVEDLLERVGGVARPRVLPVVRPGPALGYRRRLSLRVDARRVGFLAAASHELVPVERCLLAAPELDGGIALAQRWIEALQTTVNRVEVAKAGLRDGIVLVAQADGPFSSGDGAIAERLLGETPRVAGAVVHGRGWRHVFGDDSVQVDLPGGDTLQLRGGDFSQVNDAANAVLIATVLRAADAAPDDVVLDLYAGAGNLTLPLARRAGRVLAAERARSSVDALRANAARAGLDNVDAQAGDVAQALDGWISRGQHAHVVVLDPPRSGAARALSRIERLAPRRIVYVSCDPATLARDVRSLTASYVLSEVQPIDFFPQTYHVESVATLLRRDAS